MKIYTLNEILNTEHIGDERYVRYEEIERLRIGLEKVQTKAEGQGCSHSGCTDDWHSSLCPTSYAIIARQGLKED